MEVVRGLVPSDTSIAVTDAQRYLYYQPSRRIDLKIRPGDRIREGSASHKALIVRQNVSERIDGSVLGVPYYGMAVPIVDNGVPQGCVTAILPSMPTSSPPLLTIRTEDRWLPVPHEEILVLEADNRKTKVLSERGTGIHRASLSELEELLPAHTFVRCHRAFIVNVHQIAEILPDFHSTLQLIMKDKSRVPVSQTYAGHFRKLLGF